MCACIQICERDPDGPLSKLVGLLERRVSEATGGTMTLDSFFLARNNMEPLTPWVSALGQATHNSFAAA